MLDRFHRDVSEQIARDMALELVRSVEYQDITDRVFDETEGSEFLSEQDKQGIVDQVDFLLRKSTLDIKLPKVRP